MPSNRSRNNTITRKAPAVRADADCPLVDLGIDKALERVLRSIADGEQAGGRLLAASISIVEDLLLNGTIEDLRSVISGIKEMTEAMSNQECALARKLCISLDALCHCCEDPDRADSCCQLSDDGKTAVIDIVKSIRDEETQSSKLVFTGSQVLQQYIAQNACAADTIPLLDEVAGLTDAVANLENGMSKKLCLSLNTLCCAGDGERCDLDDEVEIALGDVVDSIAETETAASELIGSGADALECLTEATTGELIDALSGAKNLSNAAARIEEATAKKLKCALAALCNTEGGPPCCCNDACDRPCTDIGEDGCYNSGSDSDCTDCDGIFGGSGGSSSVPGDCPTCPGQLSLPISDWIQPGVRGKNYANNIWTCDEILGRVFDLAQWEGRDIDKYIASGDAGIDNAGKWISVGGKIQVKSQTGVFNGRIELDDIFVTQIEEDGTWGITMYEITRQGLLYADKVLRERNYWKDGNSHGISYLIFGAYTDAPDINPATDAQQFDTFVGIIYAGIKTFIETGEIPNVNGSYDPDNRAGTSVTSGAVDADRIRDEFCPLASAVIAKVFGNLLGNAFENAAPNPGGYSDLELCLVVKLYEQDPRTTTGDGNFNGSDETCLTARFYFPNDTRAFKDLISPKVANALTIFRQALLGF